MNRKILIMGLPGAGKTTLAKALAPMLGAVHFNGDEVRAGLCRDDLDFSHEDRIEQARRMGWLCDRVVEAGGTAIADFICPTEATRAAFGKAFVVLAARIPDRYFEDTSKMWEEPQVFHMRTSGIMSPESDAHHIYSMLRCEFDPQAPTALFVGRYQPFHNGHKKLIEEGLRRVGQACIAVRNVYRDSKNPFSYHAVKQRIEVALAAHTGRFVVIPLPNITDVFYGRSVGYNVERIELDTETEKISATEARALIGGWIDETKPYRVIQ